MDIKLSLQDKLLMTLMVVLISSVFIGAGFGIASNIKEVKQEVVAEELVYANTLIFEKKGYHIGWIVGVCECLYKTDKEQFKESNCLKFFKTHKTDLVKYGDSLPLALRKTVE